MRLSTKLSLGMGLLLLVLLGIHSLLAVRRQRELFEQEAARDGRVLGQLLVTSLERLGEDAGSAAVGETLETIGRRHEGPRVRWVPLASPELGLTASQRARLERGETVSRPRRAPGGEEEIETYALLGIPGSGAGVLEVRESLVERDRFVGRTLARILVAALLFACIGSLLSHYLGRRLVEEPVEALVALARRVGRGDFDQGVEVRRDDELTELGRAMNRMCEELQETRDHLEEEAAARIRTEAQLRHADRLATVGSLAAGLAHEIGTPLNVITGRAQLIEKARDLDAVKANAVIVGEEARRIIEIVRHLLDFARRAPPVSRTIDLREVAGRVVELLEELPVSREVALKLSLPEEAALCDGDATQLQQVLTNLVNNALQASEPGGGVRVEVGEAVAAPPADVSSGEGAFVFVRVADEGEGISEEHLDRIFEPFFTTKEVGVGTGLGLSVSYGIVRDHGGWIEVESSPGRGAAFTVYLPKGEEGTWEPRS